MTTEELQQWQLRDRLVSNLQKAGVWASPDETLAQLVGKVSLTNVGGQPGILMRADLPIENIMANASSIISSTPLVPCFSVTAPLTFTWNGAVYTARPEAFVWVSVISDFMASGGNGTNNNIVRVLLNASYPVNEYTSPVFSDYTIYCNFMAGAMNSVITPTNSSLLFDGNKISIPVRTGSTSGQTWSTTNQSSCRARCVYYIKRNGFEKITDA